MREHVFKFQLLVEGNYIPERSHERVCTFITEPDRSPSKYVKSENGYIDPKQAKTHERPARRHE